MEDASAMIQGVFHLLQAVAQEPQELHYILMPYEHRNTAQGATALPSRQLPVDPPDPKGVSEEFLIPYPPDPAGLQPIRKHLGLGHVALGGAGRLFPSLHGLYAGTDVQVTL